MNTNNNSCLIKKFYNSFGIVAVDSDDYNEFLKGNKHSDDIHLIYIEEKTSYNFKKFLNDKALYKIPRDVYLYIDRVFKPMISSLEKRLLNIFFSFNNLKDWSDYCLILTKIIWGVGVNVNKYIANTQYKTNIEKNFTELYTAILDNRISRQKILRIINNKHVCKSYLSFPKGRINKEESLQKYGYIKTALREFEEETQLPCNVLERKILNKIVIKRELKNNVYIMTLFIICFDRKKINTSKFNNITIFSPYSSYCVDKLSDDDIISAIDQSVETTSCCIRTLNHMKENNELFMFNRKDPRIILQVLKKITDIKAKNKSNFDGD